MTATRAYDDSTVMVDQEEFEERVRVLRKLRHLLVQQRNRLRSYLEALEREGDEIRDGDVEQFERHVELEQTIVREIFGFRRAIDPLESLYYAIYPTAETAPDAEVPRLRAHLDRLQQQVLKRNEENRALLHMKVDDLRTQIASLRAPTDRNSAAGTHRAAGGARSAYAKFSVRQTASGNQSGNVVDISR